MKTIGIIGGLGPESTVDYYKRIISIFQEQYPDLAYPEIIVFSVDLNSFLKRAENQEWPVVVTWLVEKIDALVRAGADFAVISSNTPHIVFDEVQAQSPIPLLSIVEETCRKAEHLDVKTLGLMGTKFTMEADFYQKPFRAKGMAVVVPGKEERRVIQEKLLSEIELGIFKDSTRNDLLAIVKRMREHDEIEALILGCTELPLILQKDEFGIPFLNTTAIHVESIVNYCIQS
jgi:aspartate racemase